MTRTAVHSIAPLARPLDVFVLWQYDDERGRTVVDEGRIPVVGLALTDEGVEYLVHDDDHRLATTLPEFEERVSNQVVVSIVEPGKRPTDEEITESRDLLADQIKRNAARRARLRAADTS